MKNIKTYEEFNNMTFKVYLDNNYQNSSQIKEMYCGRCDLIDLIGIEKLTNLTNIFCSNNKISSLYSIKDLINLTILSCYNNSITSLDPIKNLINLKTIDFYGNKITSLKPIKNLVTLHNIDVRNNPIDWVDYIDKQGNIWYIVLPKSIKYLSSDKFHSIDKYWEFYDQNQPVAVSRKFNF